MDDVGQTLLNWASAFGTQEMVEFLCAKGADVNKGKNRYFPKGIFIFPKRQFSQWHFPNFNILYRSFLISWFLCTCQGGWNKKDMDRYFPKGQFFMSFSQRIFSQWHFPNYNFTMGFFLICWFLCYKEIDVNKYTLPNKGKDIYFIPKDYHFFFRG